MAAALATTNGHASSDDEGFTTPVDHSDSQSDSVRDHETSTVATTPTSKISSSDIQGMYAIDTSRPPLTMDGPYTQDRALEDIPGAAHALDLFLASHMVESEQFCHESDPTKERLYFASGYGLVQFVKGLMSYEDEDLLAAIGHTKHGNVIAQQHRKKHASLARRMAGLVVGSDSISGVGFIKSMTPVERHAELIYAETLFEKALLGIVYSGDWLAFIKEALNLRSTVNTYRALGKYLDAMDAAAVSRGDGPIDTSIDPHFRSGVYLGVGATNMILSLMPSRLLSIVELFGFKGDRMHGLELLMKAGGWTEESDEPGVNAAEEGVRRSICDMALLIFHLVLSSFTVTGVSIPTASKILAYNLRRYPRGVFFLFGQGRLHLLRGQPSLAIASYQKAISIQSQYRNLHHISFWEMAIANFALWEVQESLESWRELEREATWSRAVYAYGIAVCLLQLGGEERREEAAGFLEKVPGLLQRIAGKSIPMEKFVARKSRKFKKQHNRLALPALEFGYFFLAIKNAPRPVIIGKMLPVIASLQSTLSQHAEAPEGYEGGHGGYWDDLCLASFLQGVCLRYVAHPDPDAIVDPSETLSISQADAETSALAAFQRVLDNGPKIELDHHLVYHTHYELGRLLACMGKVDEGRKHLDLVLSGKSLEVNSSTRKGKYSMEGALLMRTNAAVEALEHHRGV